MRSSGFTPEGDMITNGIDIVVGIQPFAIEVGIHGVGKLRMRQPVRGPGFSRLEAATDFVFTLRPRLEEF